jgi:hypothetical protein
VNVAVPRTLLGFGLVDVVMSVDGKLANTVQVNIGGQPRPRISYLRPFSGEQGATLSNFALAGRFLAGSTIQFTPPDGISFSAPQVTANSITTNLSIAAGAALGPRTLSVTGPGGTATLPFLIKARGASTAPTISNLVVNTPVPSGNEVILRARFDYQDPDGDIVWTGVNSSSATVRFSVFIGTGTCVMEGTGLVLQRPGQTSGTIDFAGRYRVGTLTIGTGNGSFALLDAARNISNAATFSTGGLWVCGSAL